MNKATRKKSVDSYVNDVKSMDETVLEEIEQDEQEDFDSLEEKENEILFLKQELELLKKEKENNIVHEVPLSSKKPRRILFTIAAVTDEDAMHGNEYIPGKALVSAFKFIFDLKVNEYGKYITGFEYDALDYYSNKKGQDLIDYQHDVRVARQWIENIAGVSIDAGNEIFWGDKKFQMEHLDTVYDTSANLDSLILYYNILGGGYPEIALSYEEAVATNKRLYISVHEEEVKRKSSVKTNFIKANGVLSDMMKNWKKIDILYVLAYLSKKQFGYTVDTPTDTLIISLSEFIEGIDTNTEKRKRPEQFLNCIENYQKDPDRIRIEAMFKLADYYRYVIFSKSLKSFQNKTTGAIYGPTTKHATEFLLDPRNIEELGWLKAKVQAKLLY